jgi:hypothetical protein
MFMLKLLIASALDVIPKNPIKTTHLGGIVARENNFQQRLT